MQQNLKSSKHPLLSWTQLDIFSNPAITLQKTYSQPLPSLNWLLPTPNSKHTPSWSPGDTPLGGNQRDCIINSHSMAKGLHLCLPPSSSFVKSRNCPCLLELCQGKEKWDSYAIEFPKTSLILPLQSTPLRDNSKKGWLLPKKWIGAFTRTSF